MNINLLSSWQRALVSSWDTTWGLIFGTLSNIIGSLLIITIGVILAIWAKRLVLEICTKIQLNDRATSIGLSKYLKRAGLHQGVSGLLGTIILWFVLLIFFSASVNVLGLYGVSKSIDNILMIIPTTLAATILLALGLVISKAINYLVRLLFVGFNAQAAIILGNLAATIIFLTFLLAAVSQFDIADNISTAVSSGLTYTMVLALGLLIGLGGKDILSRILSDWYEKLMK